MPYINLENKRRWSREYARKWRTEHPENIAMTNAVTCMMRANGIKKNSRSWQYIGCSPQYFRAHIEQQFKDGMNWENHGSVWHIDHIVPISWWDIRNNPEHIWDASHYSNLQPLFIKENLSKGARHLG